MLRRPPMSTRTDTPFPYTTRCRSALAQLVLRLRRGGFQLLDTQFTTPHLSRFGVVEIPREDYRRLLTKAVSGQAQFYSGGVSDDELEAFLQSTTQTSSTGCSRAETAGLEANTQPLKRSTVGESGRTSVIPSSEARRVGKERVRT